MTQKKRKLILKISKIKFLLASLTKMFLSSLLKVIRGQKINKKVKIWHIKTKWSKQRPPASVSNI